MEDRSQYDLTYSQGHVNASHYIVMRAGGPLRLYVSQKLDSADKCSSGIDTFS